ncbi:hypothetical protein [Clostridium sp. ZS2-4]|uniref:hypothetical protein n=1 Tax=Clostridium sp. ZS2-4 TaxID=2987703 RepID=UPI00227C0503|nr:hypothetical protein [Clostridium sp. ZS2-4]MCY6356302.1 hypothetical protein [Clostridium sp. ZS2-4]
MTESGFRKLYWGFLFIMIDFRIMGFDILPDTIGYILFALGFSILASNSIYFVKARNFNIVMIVLSLFSIYEKPVQSGESWIHFGSLGFIGVLIGVITIILGLLVIYNLFMGIKDMCEQRGEIGLCSEANKRWTQYLQLQIAAIFAFVLIFIPLLAIIYIIVLLVVTVMLTVKIMKFMKKCGEGL